MSKPHRGLLLVISGLPGSASLQLRTTSPD